MTTMFKPNPKKQVELTFQRLFGRTHKIEILGERMTPEECARNGYRCTSKEGLYVTELVVDGHTQATAIDRDWRRAYKALCIEVEKLYADGTIFAH